MSYYVIQKSLTVAQRNPKLESWVEDESYHSEFDEYVPGRVRRWQFLAKPIAEQMRRVNVDFPPSN